MTDSTVLSLQNISKSFRQGDESLDILKNVNLTINSGEIVAMVGQSGSGKTTLLQIAGLLAQADSGYISINNTNYSNKKISDSILTKTRNKHIGFIYQFHHLLPELTAEENVSMPQLIAGILPSEAAKQSRELLDMMGLSHRITHRPSELSGGEQQRVAIARALANKPSLVLADEPTGNLDSETSEQVFKSFTTAIKESGSAALLVTHNLEIAKKCDRITKLIGGELLT